ncbi:major facilitator superfamily protein [Actinidia rufa]|uniref:Major facilitator superfamily protein n=1 Tax=Actinidia rufa TaxID=165716 RepID=A0A7J0H6F4_9ERIC|nr:major facilitator superfamily protein [Actinidia rufa]
MGMKSETLTLFLVNLAGIMERADESLLPGVYKEVGEALHTDPTGLGSLTLLRSIVQASCYPLAAYLSLHHNRAHVIALGAFLWAAATFLVAISSTFFQVAVSRGLNGIGLAIVTPAIQSLVADSTDETNRGMAFGWLQLTGNLGSIIGGLCSVLIASTSFMGIPGWRIAFHLISSGSAIPLAAILLLVLPDDPSTAFMHGLVLFTMGLVISWNGSSYKQISDEHIYALDRSFESILASFAPPVVGILAQHVFGYKPIRKGSTDSEEVETDRENAAPLAKALYSAIGIPFVICCLIYSFLYCTYPRDRERARMHSLIDSEMQGLENPPLGEEYSQLHVSGSDELEQKETSVIEI